MEKNTAEIQNSKTFPGDGTIVSSVLGCDSEAVKDVSVSYLRDAELR